VTGAPSEMAGFGAVKMEVDSFGSAVGGRPTCDRVRINCFRRMVLLYRSLASHY